eukprot:696883-Pyramimonas_sp.AAC.1
MAPRRLWELRAPSGQASPPGRGRASIWVLYGNNIAELSGKISHEEFGRRVELVGRPGQNGQSDGAWS